MLGARRMSRLGQSDLSSPRSHTLATAVPEIVNAAAPHRVDRREALRRVVGIAASGALLPAAGLGAWKRLDCCDPPCPTGSECYGSPTGQCGCTPRKVNDVIESVNPSGEPRCCECEHQQCVDGCNEGQEACDQNCVVDFTDCSSGIDPHNPPSYLPCVISLTDYLGCIITCKNQHGWLNCEFWFCGVEFATCQAGSQAPGQPLQVQESQALASTAELIRRKEGAWAEKTWLVDGLYRQSKYISALAAVAVSPVFELLKGRVRALVLSELEHDAGHLVARTGSLRGQFDDRFLKDALERNATLARYVVRVTEKLDAGSVVRSVTGIPGRARASARRENDKPNRGTDPLKGLSLRQHLRSQIRNDLTSAEVIRRIAKQIQVPQESPLWRINQQWRSSLRHLL